MANKMLIDASHPEETRVVVVKGNRIEEFDFESEHKKQIKGNIYLAKVTRVEPSLQAAFVEYGGNRHGFLAFSEIHPDYYQIPAADRRALVEEDLARAQEEEEQEERKIARGRQEKPARRAEATEAAGSESVSEEISEDADMDSADTEADEVTEVGGEIAPLADDGEDAPAAETDGEATSIVAAAETAAEVAPSDEPSSEEQPAAEAEGEAVADEASEEDESEGAKEGGDAASSGNGRRGNRRGRHRRRGNGAEDDIPHDEEDEVIEDLGSEDAMEEVPVREARPPRRQYKIQEVIKRRQILLVQVVKEERGNKGAALTTYLSLAGRYSVLMPNTARGGGISRKITNVADRKRLKEVVRDLEVPRGMGIILRTAGANRTKPEVKRDYEYLMRLWETVRTVTLASSAPALVYEEGSLIKRSIRDLYNKDIDQIIVSGEDGYREAKDFMRMLMPSQAKVVQPHREAAPLFARGGIDAQLDRMLQPHVTLKSGGYIIINQTEALVAIDVNSGRSTREHSIEDTALQTNLEAAEEVARQLRLRDLAGLIVIDFIDMEEKRNNRSVEKKLKDCLKDDRARIQVGRISHFGLMEMSRQRIRASVLESTTQVCPTCAGVGHIRSDSSLALHVIRAIEEHLQKHSTHDLIVKVPTGIALYVLNEKRKTIDDLERQFGLRIQIQADDTHGHQHVAIEHGGEAVRRVPVRQDVVSPLTVMPEELEVEEVAETVEETEETTVETSEDEDGSEEQGRRKRRRRRRRGGSSEEAPESEGGDEETVAEAGEGAADAAAPTDEDGEKSEDEGADGRKRRRRGRRGGRKNRDGIAAEGENQDETGEGVTEAVAVADHGDAFAVASNGDSTPEPVAASAEEPTGETGVASAVEDAPAPTEADVQGEPTASEPAAAEEPAATAEPEAVQAPEPEVPAAPEPAAEEPAPAPEELAEEQRVLLTEPLVTSSSEESGEEKPKRSGWWSRRSFF